MSEMDINFDKMHGLAPAVIQDAVSGQVLMLGYMNREALRATLCSGYVTFFSRTRERLWTKGETSGNRLRVLTIAADCDLDTLLVRVSVEGKGVVCHEGALGCFNRELPVPIPTAVLEAQAVPGRKAVAR